MSTLYGSLFPSSAFYGSLFPAIRMQPMPMQDTFSFFLKSGYFIIRSPFAASPLGQPPSWMLCRHLLCRLHRNSWVYGRYLINILSFFSQQASVFVVFCKVRLGTPSPNDITGWLAGRKYDVYFLKICNSELSWGSLIFPFILEKCQFFGLNVYYTFFMHSTSAREIGASKFEKNLMLF